MSDLFELEHEISRAVSSDLYLRGLSHTLRDDEQDIDQAITLLEKSAALDPAFKRGDRAGAEADVAEAVRVGRTFIHFHHTAYSLGAVYATLGEFAKAQEWIEKAANDGFPKYAYSESDVHLERLRAIPRFRAFLANLRLEWEHIPGEPE